MPKTKECPECKSQITIDNFEWHLKNGHNKYFVDTENYDYDDLSLDEVDFLQKNIDATKDYGFPSREGGLYGSHSGHDGFDDESEA